MGRVVLATTPLASEVLTLFNDGAMRAFSVGFRPGAAQEIISADGRKIRKLLDCELMEVSAVSVPSNPDAVVRHKGLGLVPASYGARELQTATRSLVHEAERASEMTPEQRVEEEIQKSLDDLFPEPPRAA
jgi:phage head maturation protease